MLYASYTKKHSHCKREGPRKAARLCGERMRNGALLKIPSRKAAGDFEQSEVRSDVFNIYKIDAHMQPPPKAATAKSW